MPVDILQSHAGGFNDKLANSFGRLMFVYHPPSGWESDLMRFPSLFVLISPLSPRVPSMWPFPSPTQSHVHFLWGQKLVPGTRWLSGSGPVPGLRHAEPPQGPTSWGLQHQRGVGSGGRVEPGLTPLCPLHHNVWIRSHSLTRTFSVICI